MSKKKKIKQNNTNDSTAYSKSEWYGQGRRGRNKKKKQKKVYIKYTDIGKTEIPLAEIGIENNNIVIKDTRND